MFQQTPSIHNSRYKIQDTKWSIFNFKFSPLAIIPVAKTLASFFPFVRRLSVRLSQTLTLQNTPTRTHVSKTAAASFAILRKLRRIRRSVPRSVLQSLVSPLVL